MHPRTPSSSSSSVPSSLVAPPSLSWPDPLDTSAASSPLQLHLLLVDYLSSNLSLSPQSLLRLRLHRVASCVSSLSTLSNSFSPGFSSSISVLAQGSGEYFTRICVGTPPRYLYMVLDISSDVLWLPCSPCHRCYNQADPIFNPSRSSSFSPIPCSSPLCRRLQACLYHVSYGDGSFTLGDFAAKTLTFRHTRVGPVDLRYEHDKVGLFVGAAGLLDLGRKTVLPLSSP